MTKADYYRKRHLEINNQKSEWPQIIFESLALLIGIGILLAAFVVAVPEL